MDNYPVNEPPYNQDNGYDTSYNVPKSNDFAVVSMVFGIISILLCCTFCLSLPLGAMSILFAVLSKRRGEPMPSMSIFGIVLSCISMILTLFVIILIITAFFNDPEFRERYKDAIEEYYEYYDYNFETLNHTGGVL